MTYVVSRPGLVTLGETLGRVTAEPGRPFAQATSAALGIGGAESNVAIGVRRLGRAATWIGRVGADGFGDRVVRELRAEDVDVRVVVDTAPTAVMLQESRLPGRTRVSYLRQGSAGSGLCPADVDRSVVAGAGVLHLTGITPGLSVSARAAVDTALDAALGAGVRVSFDVNHRPGVWLGRDPADTYRRLAAAADVVFAGPEEAALVVGPGCVEALLEAFAEITDADIVIKLGERGCVALVAGVRHTVPAVPLLPVDTIGAGDAFVAGYLAAWLDERAPGDRLDQAVRCGAMVCLSAGDWEALATQADLALMASSDPVTR